MTGMIYLDGLPSCIFDDRGNLDIVALSQLSDQEIINAAQAEGHVVAAMDSAGRSLWER